MRGREGRRLRARRGRSARGRRSPAARPGSRSRPRGEAVSAARRRASTRAARDGRADLRRAGGRRSTAGADVVALDAGVPPRRRGRGAAAGRRSGVHVKLDTGMGRLGTEDRDEALALLERLTRRRRPRGGRAHDPLRDGRRARPGFLERAARALRAGRRAGEAGASRASSCTPPTARPCCASRGRTSTWRAAASRSTASTPSRATRASRASSRRCALESYVADVKRFEPGESAGYGRTWSAARRPASRCCRSATATATAAGCPTRAEVLIRGRRYPVAGTVSMDNITVDLGRRHRRPRWRRPRDADRRRRRASGSSPRSSRARSARSTTRSPAASPRRVPRVHARRDQSVAGRALERCERAALRRATALAGRATPWLVGGAGARPAARTCRSTTSTSSVDRAIARARRARRSRRRAGRACLPALGAVRRLAGDRPGPQLAGRRDAAARRLASRPTWRCATSP